MIIEGKDTTVPKHINLNALKRTLQGFMVAVMLLTLAVPFISAPAAKAAAKPTTMLFLQDTNLTHTYLGRMTLSDDGSDGKGEILCDLGEVDAEAMHFDSGGAVYITEGNGKNDSPGDLYIVNPSTCKTDLVRRLTAKGEIVGMDIHDGVMAFWSEGNGLYEWPFSGEPRLIFSSKQNVEGVAFKSGRYYLTDQKRLMVLNGDTMDKVADLPAVSEAIDVLPDGRMVLGFNGVKFYGIFDPDSKTLDKRPTEHNDIESWTWYNAPEIPVCAPAEDSHTYIADITGGKVTASFYNGNATESKRVTLARYYAPNGSDNLETQVLRDYRTKDVPPCGTETFELEIPCEASQIDFVFGDVIVNLSPDNRYGDRKIESTIITQAQIDALSRCANNIPEPDNVTLDGQCISQEQPNDAILSGTVTDQFGRPMAGTVVTLTGILDGPKFVETGADGKFAYSYPNAYSQVGSVVVAEAGKAKSDELAIDEQMFTACKGGANPIFNIVTSGQCDGGKASGFAGQPAKVVFTGAFANQIISGTIEVSGTFDVPVAYTNPGTFGPHALSLKADLMTGAKLRASDTFNGSLKCGDEPDDNHVKPKLDVEVRNGLACVDNVPYALFAYLGTSANKPGVKINVKNGTLGAQNDPQFNMKARSIGKLKADEKLDPNDPRVLKVNLFTSAVALVQAAHPQTRDVKFWRVGEGYRPEDVYMGPFMGALGTFSADIYYSFEGQQYYTRIDKQIWPKQVPSLDELKELGCTPPTTVTQPDATVWIVANEKCDDNLIDINTGGENWPANPSLRVTETLNNGTQTITYVGYNQFSQFWSDLPGDKAKYKVELLDMDRNGEVVATGESDEILQHVGCTKAAADMLRIKGLKEVDEGPVQAHLFFGGDSKPLPVRMTGPNGQVPTNSVGLRVVDGILVFEVHILSTFKGYSEKANYFQSQWVTDNSVVEHGAKGYVDVPANSPEDRNPALVAKANGASSTLSYCLDPYWDEASHSWKTNNVRIYFY